MADLHVVTGGGGFIGSSIAKALLSAGERVRVVDDFSTGRRDNLDDLPGKVELFEGKLQDPELTAKALAGASLVFHQAAIPSVARSVATPQDSLQANVMGTTVLIDVARHSGVRRIMFAASSSAYGQTLVLPKVESMPVEPLSPYAVSKVTGEQLLRVASALYGLETVCLRYFNIFGPRQDPSSQYAAVIPNFIMAALRKQAPEVYGDGEQTRDFCYIDNAVHANLLAAQSPRALHGEVINIACGERISLNQLLAEIGALAGVPLPATYLPARAGDVRDSLADIDRAAELLGYAPKVRVREGIARTYAAFVERYAAHASS